MDKNAIKKYAVWARRELISRVSGKALQYGITEKGCGDPSAGSVNGRLLTAAERKQRQALIAQIKEKGYQEVMEEIAYTWFNRFSALRFMEVNGYLPTHVRVFTDEDNAFKPQMITEAIHLELDGLDMDQVIAYKDANRTDGLYKYLLITQCNALSSILPGMFQRIEDDTELLFPDNLLREGSVIERMIALIPEEDWKDAVQIIGWLYQYYNTEKKDDVFAALKKNVKITKENIPAATQLFTPDWIVRYMVENSLGRLWLEGHPGDGLKAGWRYYLDEAEQEPEVQVQLDKIRAEYKTLKPEDIRCIDPCCGSGHILACLFDVLVQIYESYGYTTREAAAGIVENNLYGLDIDGRAAQLAYFAVMMKARQYDRRFFSRGIQPHVYAIAESNCIGGAYQYGMGNFLLSKEHQETLNYLIEAFQDAKEYGSILQLEDRDYQGLLDAWTYTASQTTENFNLTLWYNAVEQAIPPLIEQAVLLSRKYDVVVTNPPYMGSGSMSGKLSDYVKKNYPDSKADLFAVFIERCGQMTAKNRYQAMITQHAWMFLSSFEKLRIKLLTVDTVNMAHLGARAFEEIGGEVVQTTSFVLQKSHLANRKGLYCRLIEPTTQQGKEALFLAGDNRYESAQSIFSKIPGSSIAYWVSDSIIRTFDNPKIGTIEYPKQGLSSADNNHFLRYWFEVSRSNFKSDCRSNNDSASCGVMWFPFNKGGEFRKWYGNNEYVINWRNNGFELRNFKNAAIRNPEFYFFPHVTWSKISSGNISFRFRPAGSVFSDAGCAAVFADDVIFYALGLLNTVYAQQVFNLINPTMNYTQSTIASLPFIEKRKAIVENTVKQNIVICRTDWDSFETSWDFKRHPLIRQTATVSQAFEQWRSECAERFNTLKANEEELNRIFIDIYGLREELAPEVADKDVTVRKADLGRDIRSLVSYAVGCMFGRYSLDAEGLVCAGGEWDASKYQLFPADQDNVIPICDDEYFGDDIVARFIKFIGAVYGKDTLRENLKFIAGALGGKGQPKEVIRNYFLNDFYPDHLKIYQKRPIYWLFDSGKRNGFKCLIYMHRYQPDTIARIRTDYVHEQQGRYRTALSDLENQIAGASAAARVKLSKRLVAVRAQADELHAYEEKIHHLADQMISIDLDDGVKKNYAVFQEVLAKIK